MATEMERLAEEMKAKSESEAKAKVNLPKQVEQWPGQVRGITTF